VLIEYASGVHSGDNQFSCEFIVVENGLLILGGSLWVQIREMTIAGV
jgi:hypothetical protein